jgi:endoglucanase
MDRRAVFKYIGLLTASAALPWENRMLGAVNSPGDAVFNQSGYLPDSEKIASIRVEGGADRSFDIYSEPTGASVFQGQMTNPAMDAASGDRVALADFTPVTAPGTYRLVTKGIRSRPFPVGKDVYLNPLMLAMRAFYGQRCGCAVDLGDGYRHATCHQAGAYHPSSGRTGEVLNHGGWHDAGDYGRYNVNSGITTGTLLWAWELYPRDLRTLSLRIPESGGKLPDYLAEIRWNLEWMLSLQDSDGGVWHKQTSDQFCGFVMPEDDHLTSYIIGTGVVPYKSTAATADLAAVMAIAARGYHAYDAAFSARCLTAARQAWSWAVAHPQVTFANPPGIGTGAYGDTHSSDEILWASA